MNAGVHCAYCDAHVLKGPSRKRVCRHCGQPIFVELDPSDRSRRVMTAAQAEVAEAPCQACHDHQQDLRTLGGAIDLAERELERDKSKILAPSGEAPASQQLMERIAQRSADPHERKVAALQAAWGAALAGDDDYVPYLCLLHWAQLEEIATHAERSDVHHVRIVASGPGGHGCAACGRLDGQVMTIESERTNPTLPVPGCTCTASGPDQTGFCLCYYEPVFDDEL